MAKKQLTRMEQTEGTSAEDERMHRVMQLEPHETTGSLTKKGELYFLNGKELRVSDTFARVHLKMRAYPCVAKVSFHDNGTVKAIVWG